MASQPALPFRKSPSHVAGWRTRKRNAARNVERCRILDTAQQIRRELHLPPHPALQTEAGQ